MSVWSLGDDVDDVAFGRAVGGGMEGEWGAIDDVQRAVKIGLGPGDAVC